MVYKCHRIVHFKWIRAEFMFHWFYVGLIFRIVMQSVEKKSSPREPVLEG